MSKKRSVNEEKAKANYDYSPQKRSSALYVRRKQAYGVTKAIAIHSGFMADARDITGFGDFVEAVMDDAGVVDMQKLLTMCQSPKEKS